MSNPMDVPYDPVYACFSVLQMNVQFKCFGTWKIRPDYALMRKDKEILKSQAVLGYAEKRKCDKTKTEMLDSCAALGRKKRRMVDAL